MPTTSYPILKVNQAAESQLRQMIGAMQTLTVLLHMLEGTKADIASRMSDTGIASYAEDLQSVSRQLSGALLEAGYTIFNLKKEA
jgi:DNA polymerase I-like protein with 3'-5' exonuclease and polymerase domains